MAEKSKVQQSTPYTASEALRAVGRQLRGTSGMAARAARSTSGRGRQIDRAVDEVQEKHIVRR